MNKEKLIKLRCKAWGITEDEYYCNQCSDFSLEDMARAYRRGKNKGRADLEKANKALFESSCNVRSKLRILKTDYEVLDTHNKVLAKQIEKMKCCGNCNKLRGRFDSKTNINILYCSDLDMKQIEVGFQMCCCKWEIKEK